jgi:hypothetical protein
VTDQPTALVEFCGERYELQAEQQFIVGRDGDLTVDDNPYLHRRFLQVDNHDSLWWLTNVGTQLTATVADQHGIMQAWLAPGARLPLTLDRFFVWFTAGPTTYEFEIVVSDPPFVPVSVEPAEAGSTTIGPKSLTPDQKLVIVALCEPVLRRGTRGAAAVPTSNAAAERLGWTLTKFNRKLDNVCAKLARGGVLGLHGGPERLAVNRRARLVEYALAARLVQVGDVGLLDPAQSAEPDGGSDSET